MTIESGGQMHRKTLFFGVTLGVGVTAVVSFFWEEVCDLFTGLTESVVEDFGRSRG